MENEKLPQLTDLIELDILQKMQESFSTMTGVASLITRPDGKPITKQTRFCDFCAVHTRNSKMGGKLCEKCESYAAREALQTGKTVAYYCHAGLMDFTAPITVHGQIIGCFAGGQVIPKPPREEAIKRTARELEIDEDLYWEAAQKVRIVDKEDLRRTANFINTLSRAMSNMAEGKYLALQAKKDLEMADKMKSDFLANMSHEIRTPMNAVIGMADMALRQDMPPTARSYLEQIKSSGKALLNIVNDVLDYSKIESGTLAILPEDYEPIGVIKDVSTIIMNRLMHKTVEFLLDVDPNIPSIMNGDSNRLRQILINLANNAVKFTEEGFVRLVLKCERTDDETVLLHFSVEDSGIGIKQEDIPKLFGSFSQVDTVKNKHVEGTGLGLSIVRQLLNSMNGKIKVESEYGKGSKFSFTLPQKIVDPTPAVRVENASDYIMVGFFANKDVAEDFKLDADMIGVEFIDLTADSDKPVVTVDEIIRQNPGKKVFSIVEQKLFSREIMDEVDPKNPLYEDVQGVILADTFADVREWKDLPYMQVSKKPVSVISLDRLIRESPFVNNIEERKIKKDSVTPRSDAFVAPEANVLLVDDNAINLTVAEGLLEPLKMNVDKVLSAKEALAIIDKVHYDIIFMDHMMPEMDGVEATRVIRRFHPEYSETPIIALSANAMSGAREMFLSEGMNDFVAKPIEYKILEAKVRQWLPPEKVKVTTAQELERIAKTKHAHIDVADLDTDAAINMLGSENLFWNILKEFYRTIEMKARKIENFFDANDWPNYTIEVHAIKSASRQIGANELADLAARLEQAGNVRDEALIRVDTPDLLERYRGYIGKLAPYVEKGAKGVNSKNAYDRGAVEAIFEKLRKALGELDLDGMEQVAGELDTYEYPDDIKEKITELKGAISDIDTEKCETLMSSI